MSNFNRAVEYVLSNEGGFVDNPLDSGGATNFGVSLRFLRCCASDNLRKFGFFQQEISVSDMREMTVEQAKLIYQCEFWDKASFAAIVDDKLSTYIFDMCVNVGISPGIKIAQRSTWAYNCKMDDVLDDGILGEKTLAVFNSAGSNLLPSLRAERAGYYRSLVAENPKNREFLDGWLRRCYKL